MTRREVEQAAAEAHRLLPTLLNKDLQALALEKFFRRVQAIAGISREIGNTATAEDLVHFCCDTAVVLFDARGAAVLLREKDGLNLICKGGIGLPEGWQGRPCGRLDRFPVGEEQRVLSRSELNLLLPGSDHDVAVCSPLTAGNQPIGCLLLFGVDLQGQDLLLLDLLSGLSAGRFDRLRCENAFRLENSVNTRMMSVISSLALIEKRVELHRAVVEMAAELVQASSGSLMLLDSAGENLEIVASKGMSLPLARSMHVRIGTGISGKVAKSDFPLLVQDIETDSRVGTPNRPRFRTKSFISMPIRPQGKLFGVLNLADKEDGSLFGESDLHLLSILVAHAGILMARTAILERASMLEELSVTDPLTGLFNRRFLEKRLEEELSRSSRQKLPFSLLLADLDHFKPYNDLCGHLAGDAALKRVAELIRASARNMDIVTRYGGEEFCIILPGTAREEGELAAERIRLAIEKEAFPQEARLPLQQLTVSIGVSVFPEDAETARTLIHAADLALYQAKSEGRNRTTLFHPTLWAQEGGWTEALPSPSC